tara:strand:+ start:63791 stop:64060 length:270 start_codon:yes stop_codon:yes gene_type:complete
MSTINKRRHQRLKHGAKIRVIIGPDLEMILDMRDLSDSGLFLNCSDTSKVQLGTDVEVQTLEIDDAPILPSKVRRIEPNVGFAIEFMLD